MATPSKTLKALRNQLDEIVTHSHRQEVMIDMLLMTLKRRLNAELGTPREPLLNVVEDVLISSRRTQSQGATAGLLLEALLGQIRGEGRMHLGVGEGDAGLPPGAPLPGDLFPS